MNEMITRRNPITCRRSFCTVNLFVFLIADAVGFTKHINRNLHGVQKYAIVISGRRVKEVEFPCFRGLIYESLF
jgi:hypothetical protein